ncbi:MAG: site-specific DNA-methyltransferase [Burkholderiaceae bacterium]
MDIAEDRKAQLRHTFPDVFREDKIDFDALKRALGEWVAPDKERFGLNWPGKADCSKLIQQASVGTLLPMREQSVDFDTTENLIIEGDNLEVLKLLQKSYYGKVKMIYIDPPYNTGNEFIYPDNFHEGLQDYLQYSGQVDAEGRKQSTNTETGGRYHSNWLSMMYPRLFLARNLLQEDGIIFVSIDDHELQNLISLMNEIFGEENMLGIFTWRGMHTVRNSSKTLNKNTEYVVSFIGNLATTVSGDNSTWIRLPRDKSNSYPHDENDGKGKFKLDPLHARNYYKPFKHTFNNGVEWEAPNGRYPAYSPASLNEMEKAGEISFSGTAPMMKRYLARVQEGVPPDTLLPLEQVGFSKDGTSELENIFGSAGLFDQPKPSSLIKHLVKISRKCDRDAGSRDIILDFFAGSGTTAQSVMELNKEDKGNRKFILVQLPELTDNPDYPTIADITRERVRRVSAKLRAEQAVIVPDLLTQADDNNAKTAPDFGFKAFRLAASNFKVWDGSAEQIPDVGKTLELFANHVLNERSAEDMLYELLLKTGFALTTPIISLTLADKQVFSAADGALLICLERELSLEVIEAMVACDPFMMLCLDAGFEGKDELKVNAMQTVRAHNRNRQSSISLKVV